jgi:hypothetical protein
LIEPGENINYLQTQLGHSSPTVTPNVYAHLMKDRNPETACSLENSVFGKNGSRTEGRGYGLNRNPWKYLVGTRGFEPRPPTASIWFGGLTQFKYIN